MLRGAGPDLLLPSSLTNEDTEKQPSCDFYLFFPPLRDKDRRYLFAQFLAKDVKHETWLCERTGGGDDGAEAG